MATNFHRNFIHDFLLLGLKISSFSIIIEDREKSNDDLLRLRKRIKIKSRITSNLFDTVQRIINADLSVIISLKSDGQKSNIMISRFRKKIKEG